MTMEQVVVEWRAAQPLTPETLRAATRDVSWCHRIHNVAHLRSYIGNDGRDMVCVFAAPDAEAVRRSGRQSGAAVHTVWTARVLESAGATMTDGRMVVMVRRRFDVPADFAALHALEEKGGWCLQQYGLNHLRSYLSADALRSLCLYAAPDAEAVRQVQRKLAMPFEQAWPAAVCVIADVPAQA
jgi:hypothetical protein